MKSCEELLYEERGQSARLCGEIGRLKRQLDQEAVHTPGLIAEVERLRAENRLLEDEISENHKLLRTIMDSPLFTDESLYREIKEAVGQWNPSHNAS